MQCYHPEPSRTRVFTRTAPSARGQGVGGATNSTYGIGPAYLRVAVRCVSRFEQEDKRGVGVWQARRSWRRRWSRAWRSELAGDDGGPGCVKDREVLSEILVQPQACTVPADCPAGSFCDTEAGHCDWQCYTDSDCGFGNACSCDGLCLDGTAPDAGPASDPSCPRELDLLMQTNPWDAGVEPLDRSCIHDEQCPYGSRCDHVTRKCTFDCLSDTDCVGARDGWSATVGVFGAVFQATEWRSGVKHGLSVYFGDMSASRTPPPMGVAEYRDGDKHGDYRLFLRGELRQRGSYDSGKRAGCWYDWHGSGKLALRGAFERGMREGLWEAWFEDGKPRARALFGSGQLEQLERYDEVKWTPVKAPPKRLCTRLAQKNERLDQERAC
jgi:hypothetical protein